MCDGRFRERGEECKDRCPSTRLGRRTVGNGEVERLKLGSAVGSGNPTVEAQGKQGDRGGARSRSVDSEESTGARDLCRFLLLLYRCSKRRSIQRLCCYTSDFSSPELLQTPTSGSGTRGRFSWQNSPGGRFPRFDTRGFQRIVCFGSYVTEVLKTEWEECAGRLAGCLFHVFLTSVL